MKDSQPIDTSLGVEEGCLWGFGISTPVLPAGGFDVKIGFNNWSRSPFSLQLEGLRLLIRH